MSETTPPDDRARGLEAFDRGDFAAAARALAWYRKPGSFDLEVQRKLGWAQSQCGMHELAITTLDEAVREAPGDVDAHVFRGAALARAGHLGEAAQALNEALRLQPAHPQALAWLQWAHAQAAPAASVAVVSPVQAVIPLGGAAPTPHVPPKRSATANAQMLAWVLGLVSLVGGLFGVVIAVPLLFAGGAMTQSEREFPAPVVLTYAEFVKRKPEKGWYRIKEAALDLSEAAWVELPGTGLISDIHIPVHGLEEDTEHEPIRVLLIPEEGELTSTVREMARIQKDEGEKAATEFVNRNMDRFWIERDVEGTIPSGFEQMATESAEINKVYGERLAEGHLVLSDSRVTPGTGAVLYRTGQVLLGLACAGLLVALLTPFGYRLYVRRMVRATA